MGAERRCALHPAKEVIPTPYPLPLRMGGAPAFAPEKEAHWVSNSGPAFSAIHPETFAGR